MPLEQLPSPLWAPRTALDKLSQGKKDGYQEQGWSTPDSGTEGQACRTMAAGVVGCPGLIPWDSQSLCQMPRLRSLMWDLEPSQQCESFFGTTVLQLVVAHLAGMGFDFIVIAPLLPSRGFSFVLECRVSFLVGSSVLLSMVFNG